MYKLILSLICVTALVACNQNRKVPPFEGKYFRAKASKVDKQRDVFTIKVKGVDQSFEGARQAAEYEGQTYCLNLYGSTDIEWNIGPDTPDAEVPLENNTLTYSGTCPSR